MYLKKILVMPLKGRHIGEYWRNSYKIRIVCFHIFNKVIEEMCFLYFFMESSCLSVWPISCLFSLKTVN
jgi:hypothetical protein